MAYYKDDLQDQQDPNAQGPQNIGPSGTGTVDAGSSGSASPQAAAASGTPDKGSNFVGISQYLNANKPQAAKLGDQASGVINTSANEARTGVNSLNDTFNQKAGTATTVDENTLGKVNEAEKLNDDEKNSIKAGYNAQYAGPADLMDSSLSEQYNDANKKLNTAKTNVQSAGTEEGRKGLITQINEKPRTTGITNFDNVLLQAGGGREKLAQAATANQDVTGDLLGASNITAQQKAADLKKQNDATRAATQGAVTGATNTFSQGLAQRLKELQEGVTSKNNAIVQDLGDNAYGLDDDTLAAFGLNEGQRSFGINPNDYLKQGDINQITNATVATPEEYARYAALAELAGQNPTLLNQADIGKAGTADQYTTKIDSEKLKGDLATKEAAYNAAPGLNIADFAKSANLGSAYNPNITLDQMFTDQAATGRTPTPQVAQAIKEWGSIDKATVKDLQEKWLPLFQSLPQNYANGPSLNGQMVSYIKSKVDPFKVTADNTFAKNKKG